MSMFECDTHLLGAATKEIFMINESFDYFLEYSDSENIYILLLTLS